MGYLAAKDTINGSEGTATISINNETIDMFYIKKLEAKVVKKKVDVYTLGKRSVQHKTNGWEGKGTMTIYYVTSRFREIMESYIREGKDAFFNITVTNNDPTSSVGSQSVTLKNVNFNVVPMAMLNVNSEVLEEEIEFTFDDVRVNTQFSNPSLLS